MTSLNNLKNVRPFVETNLYREAAQKGEELKQYLEVSRKTDLEVTAEQAREIIFAAHEQLADVVKQQEEVQEKQRELKEWMAEIAPFIGLDFELCKLRDFHFIDYQFGKIKVENYHKLEQYVFHNPYTLFYECNNDSEYVWGVYFVPHTHLVEIEAVYASFHFEAIQVPDNLEDTPRQAFEQARELLQNYQQKLESLKLQAIVTILKSANMQPAPEPGRTALSTISCMDGWPGRMQNSFSGKLPWMNISTVWRRSRGMT